MLGGSALGSRESSNLIVERWSVLSLLFLMLLEHHVERTELLVILILAVSRDSVGPVAQDRCIGLLTVRCDWWLLLRCIGIVATLWQLEEAFGCNLACGVLV